MFRKSLIAYLTLTGLFILLAISCDITGDECGPFADRFKTTSFETGFNIVSITDSPNLSVQLSSVENDTAAYNELGITLFPVGDWYFSSVQNKKSITFSSAAYACSPRIPISEETITDIQIYSNKNYNSEFNADDNLAELFEVVVLYQETGYQRIDLFDFLASEPTVPDEIILMPKSAPAATETFQFTVQYFQDGIDMNFYEFTTDSITIKN